VQHPDSRIAFASGNTLSETNTTQVRTSAGLNVGGQLNVDGGLSVAGRNLVRCNCVRWCAVLLFAAARACSVSVILWMSRVVCAT
jgi:hypothetical protein